MNYNLINCINDNIRDFNSRFLLIEINKSLTNKEYRIKVLKPIQENTRNNCLIILKNLNQIHPFLFDLYNKNYIIKNEKICKNMFRR